MKRYEFYVTIGGTAGMTEEPDGSYVLANDPAIRAAIEAMEMADDADLMDVYCFAAMYNLEKTCYDKQAQAAHARNKLRAALAGLKGKE